MRTSTCSCVLKQRSESAKGVVKVGGSFLGMGCDRATAEEGPGVLAAMLVLVEEVVWALGASQFDLDSVHEVDCILCQQFS